MHNPAPVLGNETHKLLWDFDIQTDHLISAKRTDLIIINNKRKKICKIVDFTVLGDHRIKLKECDVTATSHGRIIVQELLCGPEVGEGDWRVFEP